MAQDRRSLREARPELVSEQWFTERNFGIDPDLIRVGSSIRVWWKCPNGPDHEWETPVYKRTRGKGTGCPFCGMRRLSVTNSIAALYPHLVPEWDLHGNGIDSSRVLGSKSHTKYAWVCPDCGHHYHAMLSNRTRGTGCTECRARKISGTLRDKQQPLADTHPALANSWDESKNVFGPDRVSAGSHDIVWWTCANGHSYQREVRHQVRGLPCPVCSGRQVGPENSLLAVRPDVVEQFWDFERNVNVSPTDVLPGATARVAWRCDAGPDHRWRREVWRQVQSTGCPYCIGKRVSVTNNLTCLFPSVAALWHPTANGTLRPEDVTAFSNKRVIWKCPAGPDHAWPAPVSNLTALEQGCPACAGKQVSVTNSLATKAPYLVSEWHPTRNDTLTPHDVTAGSEKVVWWRCGHNSEHEWRASVYSRVQGALCKHCVLSSRSRQEIELEAELAIFFQVAGDGRRIPVDDRYEVADIVLPEHGLVVEFDGYRWHEGREVRDRSKTRSLQAVGWRVVRVREGLEPIETEDLCVPRNLGAKPLANLVLLHLRDGLGIAVQGLDDYFLQDEPQNPEGARVEIRRLLTAKGRKPDTKICIGCGRELPAEQFSPARTTIDRLGSRCKRCNADKAMEVGAANRARWKDIDPRSVTFEKRCSECGEVKVSAAFGLNRCTSNGLQPACSECMRRRERSRAAAKTAVEQAEVLSAE